MASYPFSHYSCKHVKEHVVEQSVYNFSVPETEHDERNREEHQLTERATTTFPDLYVNHMSPTIPLLGQDVNF